MLNEFIRLSTVVKIKGIVHTRMTDGFRATDSQYAKHEQGEAMVPTELIHFQFDKLKKVPILERIIQTHVSQFCMRSKCDRLSADGSHSELIACGFARYAENDVGNAKAPQVTLDEPLAVLALVEWLQYCDVPLAEMLRLRAAAGVTEAKGANGLEEYLAFYFSAVFDKETPLTDIFEFNDYLDPPAWAKKPAALVSLFYVPSPLEEDTEWMIDGPILHQQRPSASIGYKTGSMFETLQWLDQQIRAPICFPDTNMGPDVMFVLQLQDEKKSRIWVALQSKFSNEHGILPSEILQKAVPTVTPSEWYGFRKDLKDPEAEDPDPQTTKKNNASALERIDDLPDRLLPTISQQGKGKGKAAAAARKTARKKIVEFYDAKSKEGAKGKGEGAVSTHQLRSANRVEKKLELTPDELNVLEEAGEHSVLRVVVAWPTKTHMHERALTALDSLKDKHCYFDEYNHPIVELNIEHWGKTMQKLHPSKANFVVDNWHGKAQSHLAVTGEKRRADGEPDGAPEEKRRKNGIEDGDEPGYTPVITRRMTVYDVLGNPEPPIYRERSPSVAASRLTSATAPPSTVSDGLSEDTMTDVLRPVASGSRIPVEANVEDRFSGEPSDLEDEAMNESSTKPSTVVLPIRMRRAQKPLPQSAKKPVVPAPIVVRKRARRRRQ